MTTMMTGGSEPHVQASTHARWSARWAWSLDLFRELVARDIKLRYQGSLLGMAWTLLNPLAELLVLLLVFGVVLRVDIPNFAAYLFTGLLVYGWFQMSLTFATMAIVGNRELVKRPGVPTTLLPVVTVTSNLVHFILSLPILLGLLLVSGIRPTSAMLVLPVLIGVQFVLILAFAYPVAIVHVWFRDTQHVLRVALQLLFYLTPIFYEVKSVPSALQRVYQLNPMAHMVDAYRAVLLRGEIPSPGVLLGLTVVSAVLLMVGMSWFRAAAYRFSDEL